MGPFKLVSPPDSSIAESGTVRNFDADLILDERDRIAGATSLTFPFNFFSYGERYEHSSC